MNIPADDKKPDPPTLRSKAVAKLASHPVTEPLRADALLHELQVHQIELEMQNDALRIAHAELGASRECYIDLYDFAPISYITLDSDGMIEMLNLTAAALLGVERKDLLRRHFSVLVVADDQSRWMKLFISALQQDGKHSLEATLQRPDGTVFPAQLDCAARKVGTGGLKVRIVLTDISERRHFEADLKRHRDHLEKMVVVRTDELAHAKDAAVSANHAKSIFLAGATHELRTPMHGIIGSNALALDYATDYEQIGWLTKSQEHAQFLMSLLNDIIDSADIESEGMILEKSNFSLAQIIDEVIQAQAVPALNKGLLVRSEIDASVPELLCGDAMRLRQILLNLTGNAVKFSERGTIVLRASVLEADSISVMLKLEVSDQGIGISLEQQTRLFHVFSQAEGGMRRKYDGLGLGLAICKRLALLMGGNVGVIRKEGVGSTFWVTARFKVVKL